MSIAEDLDREVIIERAEEVRSWLGSLGLSSRSTSALERELSGIIENDPGGYINGHRPLAGLTVTDVLAELQRANGGAVGQVRGIGDRVIAELRTAQATGVVEAPKRRGRPRRAEAAPAEPIAAEPQVVVAQDTGAPEAETPKPARRGRPRRTETAPGQPQAVATRAAAAEETGAPEVDQPKRRGRPRRVGTVASEAAQEAPGALGEAVSIPDEPGEQEQAREAAPAIVEPKRRGRPRRATSPDQAAMPATNGASVTGAPNGATAAPEQVAGGEMSSAPHSSYDPSLERLMQLWLSLHPQGRRAIVLYASTLVFEEIADR